MKNHKCSCESCEKEFEKPIMVTNFSVAPQKETYYACPYCLTKISSIFQECNETQVSPKETAFSKNKKIEEKRIVPPIATPPQRILDRHSGPQAVTIRKLESLEKEKMNLLAELDKLREGAIQKVSNLEEELSTLKEEAEILKKMIV